MLMDALNQNTNIILSPQEKKEKKEKELKKMKELKALNEFKRKYFDYYDDIKISHHEDW